jgi:hypothetical protein
MNSIAVLSSLVAFIVALVDIFGDDACLQFGGGTLGHPWICAVSPVNIGVHGFSGFLGSMPFFGSDLSSDSRELRRAQFAANLYVAYDSDDLGPRPAIGHLAS